jgi:hypothetical protein
VAGGRPYSPARFRELAIYALAHGRKRGGLDPRDLWEAMFAADMEAFRQTGQSITGATWIKTETGVRPKKRGERAARTASPLSTSRAPGPTGTATASTSSQTGTSTTEPSGAAACGSSSA